MNSYSETEKNEKMENIWGKSFLLYIEEILLKAVYIEVGFTDQKNLFKNCVINDEYI